MTEDDKKHFGEVLKHFSIVHRQAITKTLVRAYWEDMKHMTRQEFDTAVRYLKLHSQWFPKPAQFNAARRSGWL